MTETEIKIEAVCENLKKLLFEKNKKYGDSALNPINIFAKTNTGLDKLLVRLDDKISRINNSEELRKNDVWDMLGYLVLLIISKEWIQNNDLKE